jgi:hypothetical protein
MVVRGVVLMISNLKPRSSAFCIFTPLTTDLLLSKFDELVVHSHK